jgi:hypothetical protein
MILGAAPGRIPKPCVVGSNPTGGADAFGRAGNDPAEADEVLSNRREIAREQGGDGCAGRTAVRSDVSAEVPDSVYGTRRRTSLRRAQRAKNDGNNGPRS